MRALGRLAMWQIQKRLTLRPKVVTLPSGVRIWCYRNSVQSSLAVYCRGLPEFDDMVFMLRYLRPGDGFIDVGANVGLWTLLAAKRVGQRGKIEAFEPDRCSAQRLRDNVILNGFFWVRVHEVAATNRPGIGQFVSGKDALSELVEDAKERNDTCQVECVRLDDALHGDYALAKLDIEGAEPLALEGAERLLSNRNPPVWIVEINGKCRRFGVSEEELAARLRRKGYRMGIFDAERGEFDWRDAPWRVRANCLIIAEEKIDWVRERVLAAEFGIEKIESS